VAKRNLLDLLKSITSRWHWLVAAMIIGGFFGWGISFFMPPLYESHAVFSITLDYTQTGALSDIEEDQAMRGVGDIIFSDAIVRAALQDLAQNGIQLSREEFYQKALFEREEFRWAIRYRDTNPDIAFQVIEAWSQQADSILQNALQHARMLASYQTVLVGLENCLQRTTGPSELAGYCTPQNLDQILNAIDEIQDLITSEKEMSKGLFSALSVELFERASLPAKPVRYQVNILVLSAASLGLLIAIFIILARLLHHQQSKPC